MNERGPATIPKTRIIDRGHATIKRTEVETNFEAVLPNHCEALPCFLPPTEVQRVVLSRQSWIHVGSILCAVQIGCIDARFCVLYKTHQRCQRQKTSGCGRRRLGALVAVDLLAASGLFGSITAIMQDFSSSAPSSATSRSASGAKIPMSELLSPGLPAALCDTAGTSSIPRSGC